MSEVAIAARKGLTPLGIFRGLAMAGCEPDEMGIGLAFVSQALTCMERIGTPHAKLNVDGGAISIGHPYGIPGARMCGHILLEGRRRKLKYGAVTMCLGGGMGAAGLFEFVH